MKIVGEDENQPGPQPGPSGISADVLKNAEYIKCEECKGTVFEEKMMIKKVSKFLTGSDRDSIAPVPVVVCSACGHLNEMFKPTI
jgi:uncharacterized Zn finger protein